MIHRPLLLVGAYREGEIGRDHPLQKTLDAMSRLRGVRVIPLRGLTTTAVASLLQVTTSGKNMKPTGLHNQPSSCRQCAARSGNA